MECFDSQDHDASDNLDGSTTDATHYRCIRSASGCSTPFSGKADTGTTFNYSGSGQFVFGLIENYARLEDLNVEYTGSGANCNVIQASGTGNKCVNIVVSNSDIDGSGTMQAFSTTGVGLLCFQCIVHTLSSVGGTENGFYSGAFTGEVAGFICCTASVAGSAFLGAYSQGTNYVFSCLAQDASVCYGSNIDTKEWNLAEDDTADGTYYYNSQDISGSLDADFLPTASIDWDAAGPGDGNAGRSPVDDLSASYDPDSFFTGPDALYGTCIQGNTRPAGTDAGWDVGAGEYVAAGGLSIPIAFQHYQQQ